MENIDASEKTSYQTTAFRQSVSYNARKKISSSTTREERIQRFDRCWNEFIKILPEYKCYDESWLLSQLFNNIARFYDESQKEELLDFLKKRYGIQHIALKPPRARKTQVKSTKTRRNYNSKKTVKDERRIQTLDETKEISGLDFSYITSSYGIVFPNGNLLKDLSIKLQIC
jgi:hypothetical protein